MSFSVSFIGKPDAIRRKLAEHSEQLSGQSKEEFDTVRPALETVLDQNVGNGIVLLNANGHATFSDPNATPSVPTPRRKTYGQCSVEVRTLGQIAE